MQTTLLSGSKAINATDKSNRAQEGSSKETLGFDAELQKEIEKSDVATNEIDNSSEKQAGSKEEVTTDTKESSIDTIDQESSAEIAVEELQDIEISTDENAEPDELKEEKETEEPLAEEIKIESSANSKKNEVSEVLGLLKKIENAKNIDTALSSVVDKKSELSEALNTKDQTPALGEKNKAYDIKEMIASENNPKKEEGKSELKNSGFHTEPINHAIKNFSDQLPVADRVDLTGNSLITPNNTSSVNLENISKSVSHLQTQAQLNTALEQPLELHSKNASALLGEKVLLMMKKGTNEVQIRLDPAELGSMMIKMQMTDDKMQLTIHTQVGQARDLIEQNLPRLREQLAEQGVTLGNANIEQQTKHQNGEKNNQNDENNHSNAKNKELGENIDEFTPHSVHIPSSNNMIDYYA